MSVSIDFPSADKMLLECLNAKSNIENEYTKIIKSNLEGGHKTYKYILLTGLLAKSVEAKANPLTLQAGSALEGAYDARSLCHKVFVPFERKHLSNVLGGSNEPFLNKPARFQELSEKNAVRRGKDKEALDQLILLFGSIKDSETSKGLLIFALATLKKKIEDDKKIGVVHVKEITDQNTAEKLINTITSKSFEGETVVIVVGALEKTFHRTLETGLSVVCHKVNQSGASSKEVGDIDVLQSKDVRYSIEVKDKGFTDHDIQHAFEKMMKAGLVKGLFVTGPRGKCDPQMIVEQLNAFKAKGFNCDVQNLDVYSGFIFFRADFEDENFGQVLIETAKEINCKQDTLNWIIDCLRAFALLD